jgi:AraC-like DNA-binding protein
MQRELQTVGIDQILRLSSIVDEYAMGSDFILGEASGSSALEDTRILDLLQYPIRFDGYILFFLKKGNFQIDFNLNTYKISDRSLLISVPGNIIRIPALDRERMKETELIFAVLSREFVSGLHVDFGKAYQDGLMMLKNPCVRLNEEQLLLAEHFFTLGKLVLHSSPKNKRQIISGLLSSLSYLADDIWSDSVAEPQEVLEGSFRTNQVVERFVTLVTQYHNSERSMQFYADKLCLTPKYLSKIVKQATGRSGPDWIDTYVVLEAKNLLRYSDLSIKEIVWRLNFANSSVFNKFFRTHTGISPSDYRKGLSGVQHIDAGS